MKPMSDKSIERLLYLISPLGLLAIWQLLLMAGFGDRRFIPAPSDIAVRFAQMVGSGELALHTAVTLWRIAAGYVIGAIPAVAVGLLMAMFRPVRLFFDPLIAALFGAVNLGLLNWTKRRFFQPLRAMPAQIVSFPKDEGQKAGLKDEVGLEDKAANG